MTRTYLRQGKPFFRAQKEITAKRKRNQSFFLSGETCIFHHSVGIILVDFVIQVNYILVGATVKKNNNHLTLIIKTLLLQF